MGCLQRWMTFACLVLALSACGGNETPKNNGDNNGGGECTSNADCPGGVCDLSTNTCQGGNNGNNGNNTTGNNTTGNNGNNTTGNNTTGNNTTGNNTTGNNTTGNNTTGNNGTNNMPECGDGVLDAGELCDFGIPGGAGTCPVNDTDCPMPSACQTVEVIGSAGDCTAECSFTDITACVNGDGCCPGQCDVTNDNDCSPKFGQACADDTECPASGAGPGFCLQEADYRWPGGYCAGACTTDADCDANSHCTGRICVPNCTTNADCRTGYECYDYFGTGSTMCAPAPTTAEGPGGACTTDADCLGALFGATCLDDPSYPAGYCISGCQVDADCPADSHCGTTDAGNQLCLPNCAQNADCRMGYECFDWLGDITNTCGPVANGMGAVGDACGVLQDCAGGQTGLCITAPDWDGGYCSVSSCSAVNPCPTGSHCAFVDPVSQEGICVDDCAAAGDCRTNYDCIDRDEDGASECAPSGSGAGDVGAACAGVYDCAGGLDAFCLQEEANGVRGGYCSLNCTADADCGANGHCAFIDSTTNEGACLANCAVDGDCRADGYGCYDWDEDTARPSTECAPSGTGMGATGDACLGVWECTGGNGAFCVTESGTGWEGGYCSWGSCTSDADCVGGGHCGFQDATTNEGICLDTCATDADCRGGVYACYDLDRDVQAECLPAGDGQVGDPCGGFWDCSGREYAICIGEDPTAAQPWVGGYCIQDCTPGSGTTCPVGSTCVTFDVSFSACLEACTSSAQCRAGYTCAPVGATNACVPS